MTTPTQETVDRITKILREHLGIDHGREIIPEDSLIDDLSADSLDVVELTMVIEEEFSIEITDEKAEASDTVGKICETVHELLRVKSGEAAEDELPEPADDD